MSPSISPISQDQSLKSNTTEIGIASNLCNTLFKVTRFVLNHPTLVITFGLAVQALLSSAYDMAEATYPEANQNGMTPLHIEADAGNLHHVQALVKSGANIHAKDNNGQTPLDLACNVLIGQLSAEEDDNDLMCIPAENHLPASRNHISIVDYLTSLGASSFCTVFSSKEEELVMTGETTTQNLRL